MAEDLRMVGICSSWVGEPVGFLVGHCCHLALLRVVGQGGHWGSWGLGKGSGFAKSGVVSTHSKASTSSFTGIPVVLSQMALHSAGRRNWSKASFSVTWVVECNSGWSQRLVIWSRVYS